MLLNLFVVHRTSSITTNENKSVVLNIKKQTLVFCLLLFFFTNVCSSLFAQEYFTTVDWLNFVDVPSYLYGSKLMSINAIYYVKYTSHKDTYTVGDYIASNSNDLIIQATYLISCINWDWRLSEKITLSVLPIYTWGASPGGVRQNDLVTWLKMKYFPLTRKNFYSRLAFKVPILEPEVLKKQLDIDISIIYSKGIKSVTPEVLLGYRYRQRTYRDPDVEFSNYGAPGNEFHCRIGLDFPVGKDTRECIFLLGYFSQDKKEYFYTTQWSEQALVYKKPYKIAAGFTLSHFFKGKTFFGENTWFNVTILKAISWRNELGGWALVLSGKL